MGLREYYDRRASEYDDVWLSRGVYADRDRPGWHLECHALEQLVSGLPERRTLDVGCGTGFLTRHLRGNVVALDQSDRMLEEARRQAPTARFEYGDALDLPFEDGSFDRVFTSFFYGHLEEPERLTFLSEARRVAPELVVVDSAVTPRHNIEERQQRELSDGSRWIVYKRYFVPDALAAELGGGEILLDGAYFVCVRA
jgi:ubiquinone/menaquinone biosynthesis C-methylase UbiE